MKAKGLFIGLLFVLSIVLINCSLISKILGSSSTDTPTVTIENYPRPDFTLDFSPFEDVGCPPDGSGRRSCEEDSPLFALGCDRIQMPSDLLGALEPALPVAVCLLEPLNHPDQPELMEAEGEYIYRTGGLMPVFVRYIIFQDGQFQLIKSEEQFRDVFAPVETEDEALSYALALRNLSAYYDLEFNPINEYFVDRLEDTHVESSPEGYSINLYHYQFFGCGPHFTRAIVLRVTEQGIVEEISSEEVYKDPSEDGLCVD